MCADAGLPAGYAIRAGTLEDVAAVVALRNVHARQYVPDDDFDERVQRLKWTLPYVDVATDTRVVTGPAGEVVGFEQYFCEPPHVIMRGNGCVHPGHVGRGIGSALLAWHAARAESDVKRAPEGVAVVLRQIQIAADAVGIRLVEERGYAWARYFLEMRGALTGTVAEPEWPAGVRVREHVVGVDDEAAYEVVHETGEDHWGIPPRPFEPGLADFRHWLKTDEDVRGLFVLAVAGEEIAGFLYAYPSHGGRTDTGYLAALGVARRWRHQGVGRALLLHVMGVMRARGKREAALHCDAANLTGATRIYTRVGMRETRRYAVYEKVLRAGRRLDNVGEGLRD